MDQDVHQVRQIRRAFRIIGISRGPERSCLVEHDAFSSQYERQSQEGGPGVAVGERVEEGHVQMDTRRASRQWHREVGALPQAGREVASGVRRQRVPFPTLLGVGVAVPEGDGGDTENRSLPVGQQLERERLLCRGVRVHAR
nr:hypothetical protein [Herbidospora daliensis]